MGVNLPGVGPARQRLAPSPGRGAPRGRRPRASSSTAAPARMPPRGRPGPARRPLGAGARARRDHMAKHTRGLVARHLCQVGRDAAHAHRPCARWSAGGLRGRRSRRRPGRAALGPRRELPRVTRGRDARLATSLERVCPVLVFLVAITVVAEIADVAGRVRRGRPLGRPRRPAPGRRCCGCCSSASLPWLHRRPQPRHDGGAADAGGHRRRPAGRHSRRAVRHDDAVAGQHRLACCCRSRTSRTCWRCTTSRCSGVGTPGTCGWRSARRWPRRWPPSSSSACCTAGTLRGRYELDAPPEPHDRVLLRVAAAVCVAARPGLRHRGAPRAGPPPSPPRCCSWRVVRSRRPLRRSRCRG